MEGREVDGGELEEVATPSTLQDLLADLNGSTSGASASRSNAGRIGAGTSTNSGPWLPSARSSPARSSSARQTTLARPYSYLSRRRSSNPRVVPVSSFDQTAMPTSSPGPGSTSVFPNPNRSIFTSGQPTSSISVNTAHASMSAPPPARESRPLAALSGSSSSTTRRPTPQALQLPHTRTRHRVSTSVEKDADDPTVAMDEPHNLRRGGSRTSAALTQLFVDGSAGSPTVSRHGSYLRTLSGTQFTRARPYDSGALAPHVYAHGLLGGKFSDITVHAFGTSYKLHRLLLDRAPFFSTAFSGPWLEANSTEMKLDPADVDPNITQAAFELALKRIYGCEDPEEEDQEAIGLFAVACWLEMDDLLEASIESLLRQMTPSKLSTYIRFVTGNYYGAAGTRILTSAKAMLCRDGWRMKLRCWDGIPADIIRDIIGGDSFFITGEWERWLLAKRLLNRRLKCLAGEAGLVDDESGKMQRPPKQFCARAVRDVRARHQGSDAESGAGWTSFYIHPDVLPILHMLDDSIHYVHLSFEELQHIRSERDVLGVPILPEKVISSALWMQMELRQKIVNAEDQDLELGLAQQVDDVDATLLEASHSLGASDVVVVERDQLPTTTEDDEPISERSTTSPRLTAPLSAKAAGKRRQAEPPHLRESGEAAHTVHQGTPAKRFWVPTTDATFPIGEVADDVTSRPDRTSRGSRNSTARPDDIQWAGDLTSLANAANESLSQGPHMQSQLDHSPTSPRIATAPSAPRAFTDFPPYRFSVEFPAAAMLKENKRFYSHTIWYAGSLWNVYVQKKDSAKGLQLGVYLHREKQSESMEVMLANYGVGHSVEERIGRLEREPEVRRRVDRRVMRDGDSDATLVGAGADLDTISGMLSRPARRPPKLDLHVSKGGTNVLQQSALPPSPNAYETTETDDEDDGDSEFDADEALPLTSASLLASGRTRARTPALPPYIDSRPTIKTYFKIYTPGKDGRVLTVYESKPDKFNFSQSWGWKSGSLDLDGDLSGDEGREAKEKRLRFMVVLGTV